MMEEKTSGADRLAEPLKTGRLRALEGALGRLERRLAGLRATSERLSWLRLVVFVGGFLLAGLAYELFGPWAGLTGGLVTLVLFAAAVYYHRRIERSIARHHAWRELKAAQRARATLDWEAIPARPSRLPRPEHPFEADLALVGPRSLHHLLDTAVSYEGSTRLGEWLGAPVPDLAASLARQAVVRELVPRRAFRDRLTLAATLAAGAEKDWRAGELLAWLDRHRPDSRLGRWLLLFALLAALNIALFVANRAGLLPPWWQVTFFVYLGLTLAKSRTTGRAWDEAMDLLGALRQLRAVFRHLEGFSYRQTPCLGALCAPFRDPAQRPSADLSRLTYLVAALGLRGNPLVYFALNAVVPWEVFFAYLLERYRAGMAGRARAWLDVWFEVEALGSLATAAYFNPAYTFPTLVEGEVAGEPVFAAEGLGHPLIPDAAKVSNDFSVPSLGQVTLISGSNMAGKSVFLKTVAVNLVLAYAGGAVDARRLRSRLFRLFTSMAISDSVTDGISYFYAEVRRLRALLDALEDNHPLPLLYCIDEIFRGTNNRERLIGARAYVRALAGQRGVGLISTHDLELTHLAEEVAQVVNYHFRDQVAGDRMVFDYRLRSGPSPTTNALRLMRLQGLPLPSEEETG